MEDSRRTGFPSGWEIGHGWKMTEEPGPLRFPSVKECESEGRMIFSLGSLAGDEGKPAGRRG